MKKVFFLLACLTGVTWTLISPAWAGNTVNPSTNINPAIPATTPTEDFILHGDGTTTHKKTSLMWMRCSLGQTWAEGLCTGTAIASPWQDALQAAADFNTSGGFAGHTDWRLPNIKELASLIEEQRHSPAINSEVFPGTPFKYMSILFWSSTLVKNGPTYLWAIDFQYPVQRGWGKNQNGHVRLVRDIP